MPKANARVAEGAGGNGEMKLKKLILAVVLTFISATSVFSFDRDDRERFRREIDREKRDFEFDRKEVNQAKFWDARLNKVITDIHGNRVRVEQFVTRPASNQVKFTAISRRKNRLDYMWFLQEFNGDLPRDIVGIAFRDQWTEDEKPTLYPITQTYIHSNTIDSIEHRWEQMYIGKIELRTSNGSPMEDYLWGLIPTYLSLKINGQLKKRIDFSDMSAIPTGIQWNYGQYPDGSRWSLEEYPDNTFLKREQYIIDDDGKVVNIWYDKVSNINEILEKYNIERIFTAFEFNGRTIDIILIPRIFLKYVLANSLSPYNGYLLWAY